MISVNQMKKPIKAKFFKALSDPLRLEIIEFLSESEKCVCDIVEKLDVVQPLVSRHLRILRESGVVTGRKDGTKRLYKLSNPKIKKIIDLVDKNMLEELSKQILKGVL